MLTLLRELMIVSIAFIFQYILLESRFKRTKTLIILIAGTICVILLNMAFIVPVDYLLYKKLYPLTVSLPIFIFFMIVSKHKGFLVLFNLLTAVFLCYVTAMFGYLLSKPFQLDITLSIIGQIAAFPLVLLYVLKVFRPLYLLMLDRLKKGWALFCLIPLISYALLYLLTYYPQTLVERPENAYPMALTILLTMIVYGVICFFFQHMKQQFAQESEQQLLQAQVIALQNQSDAVMEMEEKTRILRHDLRHNVHNIGALLTKGDLKTAMEFIGSFDDLLEQADIPQYCDNPIINAILTYYLENSRKEGIEIITRLDVPKKIPVKEMELSTVFANAIENARNACSRIPAGAVKFIEIVCLSKPNFVLEIANSYCNEVLFDKNGLPVSKEAEHGIGTQSIDAFVKKYNAILDYQTDNGVFRLRILL